MTVYRTIVFDAPEYGMQILVELWPDKVPTLAIRADSGGVYGPSIDATSDTDRERVGGA